MSSICITKCQYHVVLFGSDLFPGLSDLLDLWLSDLLDLWLSDLFLA